MILDQDDRVRAYNYAHPDCGSPPHDPDDQARLEEEDDGEA